MSNLKFRAFNKKEQKFIYSDWKYGELSFWETVLQDYSKEYERVQQFTGFLDKNGREIFDGDFVEHELEDYYTQEEYLKLEKLGKKPQIRIFRDLIKIPNLYRSGEDYSKYWVGGNIFENPDMKAFSQTGLPVKIK